MEDWSQARPGRAYIFNGRIMGNLNTAPGGPGSRPTWTSSAKDAVITALGASRLWITLGFGIVNEIYWPTTGMPQIRDLGFIVCGPSGWFEVKRVNRYQFSTQEHFARVPQIIHEGEGYRLELEIAPDPLRDVALISYRLIGEGVRLYALLAPHLGNSGEHNSARAGADLSAWNGRYSLCLISSCGFSRSSAGYVGVSDGWQDFAQHGRMTWSYGEATDGNVALLGELQDNEGVLALGLSQTVEGARTLARSSLSEGYAEIRRQFVDQWQEWSKSLSFPNAPSDVQREASLSAVVLKVHEDRTFPGSVVASLSVPWGSSNDGSGGYHLVWVRDCVEAGLALFTAGQVDDARHMLSYLIATQHFDGGWSQNSFPSGVPFWTGEQLDQVGFPVIFAAKLAEESALEGLSGVDTMIRRAVGNLVHRGPSSQQDRWEENGGISPFTLAVEIAALIAGAEFLDEESKEFALSLADYWDERVEDWTYVRQTALAKQFDVDGYYVRIGPTAAQGGLLGLVEIHNRSGESVPAASLIGMEYLYLVRLGLRAAQDSRIQNTLKVTEALLKVETPHGVAYHRYNGDGYGEHADGRPFNGTGIGRAWPLLTGERGHYELQLGRDPLTYLEMMARMTGPTGLIPEQVWDSTALPERGLKAGKPTGGAMPLVWAHAEFLKLLYAREQKRPIEMLKSVEAHCRSKSRASGTWHWRPETPFDTLAAGRDLLVDLPTPFILHVGFDGWQSVEDRRSTQHSFGRHCVRLNRKGFVDRKAVDFAIYYVDAGKWEDRDHHVCLIPPEVSEFHKCEGKMTEAAL
jgi:glucoamylase